MQPGQYSYDYPRPSLAVDCVVFGFEPEAQCLKVLLIQRGVDPFLGAWALPGGFVLMDETLDDAARRELAEEAGLRDVFLEQLHTFGALDRDPRGRVISVAYMGLVRPQDHLTRPATDAQDAAWFSLDALPTMPFDHPQILDLALARLRERVRYRPIGFALLPEQFTSSQLRHLYEVILGEPLDKRNFQRKINKLGILRETGQVQQNVAHRAARYYTFDRARYQELEQLGLEFRI